MSRREAGLILGISPSANTKKVKEAHKRIMILNHPDKGEIYQILFMWLIMMQYQEAHLTWQWKSMKQKIYWILKNQDEVIRVHFSDLVVCSINYDR